MIGNEIGLVRYLLDPGIHNWNFGLTPAIVSLNCRFVGAQCLTARATLQSAYGDCYVTDTNADTETETETEVEASTETSRHIAATCEVRESAGENWQCPCESRALRRMKGVGSLPPSIL